MANTRVQYCALGTADSLFYLALVRNGSSKGYYLGVTHRLPVLVDGNPQLDPTGPSVIGVRQTAFRRTPSPVVRTETDEKARRDYLVQVPAARGRVIPDIDSIKEDFPALCDPTTAIIGRSMSAPTLDENETTSRTWEGLA